MVSIRKKQKKVREVSARQGKGYVRGRVKAGRVKADKTWGKRGMGQRGAGRGVLKGAA